MDEDATQPEAGPSKRKRDAVEDEGDTGPNDRVANWYILSLDAHISSTKSNLLGPYIVPLSRGAPSARQPTIVPPLNAEFTPSDKAEFFLALTRHSRFRLDLIARDIGRDLVEVENYLDLLEDGYATVQRSKGFLEGQRSRVGRYKKRYQWEEGMAAAAREVSEGWIAEEESIAGRVRRMAEAKEATVKAKALRDARDAERKATVRPLRAPPVVVAKRVAEAKAVKELEQKWRLEDWMDDLSVLKMEALGTMLEPPARDWASKVRASMPERIAQEDQTIIDIQAIKKKKRTAEQKVTLRKLVRRKDSREKHRLERLLASGMTIDEIEAAGGPDQVFRIKDAEVRANGGDGWRGPEDEAKAARQKMVKGAEDVGVRDEFVKRGWDVFDMTKVAKWHQCFSGESTLSSATLADLYSRLVAYLAPLVLQAIITAEQDIATSPELEPDPEITMDHVQSALAMRNEDPIGELLAFRKRWAPEDKRVERAKLFGFGSKMSEYDVPFRDIAVMTGDPVDEETEDDIESTLSDEEDEQLDEAMDEMDVAYDEVYEHRLWEGMRSGAQVEDDAWEKGSEMEAAEHKRDDYIASLDQINKDRRWRRSILLRSSRMPTQRLKTQASKYRLHKSAAVVEDDEE